MSLKCSKKTCANNELARGDQLAFYQDLSNNGWNLGLNPEFGISQCELPANIQLVDSGDSKYPYKVICSQCLTSIGKVSRVCGFEEQTINFSAKRVLLLQSRHNTCDTVSSQKWSKVVDMFPEIRRITPTVRTKKTLVGSNTIHFHGIIDLPDMIKFGNFVASRSHLIPRRYQWRAYFFACMNNVLLCLPTGMGKTLIANMVMKAYRQRNPEKGQIFIVPTVVLVEQQARAIEKNTALKVKRRSSEQGKESPWSPQDICVCTHAMLLNAIKMKQFDMSQLSLLVLDEAHETNSSLSQYGLLLPFIRKCPSQQRPRVLALTASPAASNSTDMLKSITSLCEKLLSRPYTPLLDDEEIEDEVKDINCNYISIHKSSFEIQFESFVLESLETLSKLHKYFISNWSHITANESTERVNSIGKLVSNARLVAQKNNDIKLLYLIEWMSKWVDALDMLHICGPRKLIEFITADLEFAQNNETSMEVSIELSCMLERINRMGREYTVPADSERVQILLKTLRLHLNDQERIIVFVERRSTAERLCRRLRSDPEVAKMNPEYIVGNTNGSFPKEMQQSVLEKFHKGESQVLVATTVLEQGIDVADCGVVVCFDGVTSIKSIIQSRGRARKNSALFLVFVPADKQKRVNDLTSMETSMNLAIHQLMREKNSSFDKEMWDEIKTFLDTGQLLSSLDEDEPDEQEGYDDEEDSDSDDGKVWFQIRFFNFKDSNALSRHIRTKFKASNDHIKVMKKYITTKFAVKNVAEDGSNIIQNVSTAPDKNLMSSLQTWFEVIVPSCEIDVHKIKKCVTVDFDVLTGFHFKTFTTVCYDSPFIWKQIFKLNIVENEIILLCGDNHFSIRPIDVDGPILLNDTKDFLNVFLCLRTPPPFFIEKQLAPFDFSTRSFNLCLKRNKSVDPIVAWVLRNALQKFSLQVYNVCNLQEEPYENDRHSHSHNESFIRSYLIKVWHSKHSAILPPRLPDRIFSQFKSCSSVNNLELLLDVTVPIRFQPLHIQQMKDYKVPFSNCDLPTQYEMFGRVEVTPNRLIFMPRLPFQKNRVFRYFPNSEDFLIVNFTDEHEGNPWRSQHIYRRFFEVLLSGFKVGGKHFTFLGCSNSQLREGRCWFSSLDRETVYKKIGEFPPSMNAGRKLTRLALAFSSSIETVELHHERYLKYVEPDVKVGTVNFSDGIGRMSQNFLSKVKAVMKLYNPTVTAFQIRVGGIKGVISGYDEQIGDVMFRKSMKKFESDHNMLEVLNYNRPLPLYLNRNVILLLSSYGVPTGVFLELQFNELFKCMDALVENDKSLAFVKSRSEIFNWEILPSDHIVNEPIFRQIIISNVINAISNIVDHANIFVPNGRVLMGVLDETNTLEYGEVYAHIIEDDFDMELEGKVLIFRNPCVLPSDIRILNARKHGVSPRVKQLYRNCLVIPSKGPSSHAHECSGGDLDGDLYYIVWDHNLIPNSLNIPGEEVIDVETEEVTEIPNSSNIETMMKFYCDYISINQLGMIANAHLATADRYGMCDQRSITLGRYVTAETDAPKKGFTVGPIDKELLPDEYPDYMRKIDKHSYRSNTVLGELFRQAYPILEVLLEKRIIMSPKVHAHFCLDEKTIDDFYLRYSNEITKLLQSFDLISEVDLFSGTPMWRKGGYISVYKHQTKVKDAVVEVVQQFWLKWIDIFERWRTKIFTDQTLIQEWYYLPKCRISPLHSFSILAMPYVDFENGKKKSISESIQNSMKLWVQKRMFQWLDEWRQRHDVGVAIMQKLGDVECHFYGSSMLGLSEQYSDVDVYASDQNLANLEKSLRDIDGNVISMKKPHPCVSLTFDSLPLDVTNYIGGVKKSYSLAETFDKYGGLWPALRVLIEWARNVGIVKSGGSQGLMTVVSLCHLFIYFATSEAPKITTAQTPYTIRRFKNWMESLFDCESGSYVYNFLKLLCHPKSKEWIALKTDPLNGEPLIKSGLIDELCKNAQVAIYVLAAQEGDIEKLFDFCAKQRLFKIDKRYMNPATISDDHQDRCFQEIEAQCNPSRSQGLFLKLLVRNGVFYLEATGDHTFFADVEKGLNKIHCRILSLRFCRSKQIYHIKDSTMIIGEFGNGLSTEVSFSFYRDEFYMPQHTGKLKSVLVFRNREKNLNWCRTEYLRYEKQFISQLQLFNSKRGLAVKGTRVWRFFGKIMCTIRCGNHYLFNVPETLHNTFETITLQQVQINIARYEQALCMENQENIIQEFKKNSISLFQTTSEMASEKQEPLKLMPLQELKSKTIKTKMDAQITSATAQKNSSGIRHLFYPIWKHGLGKVHEFAAENGFVEIKTIPSDQSANISVLWRKRELVIACNNMGIINEIRHRSVRWLSATIKGCEESNGDDTRTYLESRASLDDDENCLETIVDYLDNKSVFTEEFLMQISNFDGEHGVFSGRPLIPEMFRLNWRFLSMRRIVPIRKFTNANNDILILNDVYDGIFQHAAALFEWFPKHQEFEIRLCMENLSAQELCQKSYELNLKLFNAVKQKPKNII